MGVNEGFRSFNVSYFKPGSRAEVTDRVADLTALAAGLAALIYVIGVVEPYVPSAAAGLLDIVQLVAGIVILAGYLPLLTYFKTRFGGEPINPWKSDGFIGAVVKRAGFTAFSLLILFMVVLTTLEKTVLSRISAAILLDGVIAFALLAFSIAFLAFSRSGTSEDGSRDNA